MIDCGFAEAAASSDAWASCRAPPLQFQHRTPSRTRSHGVLLLFAPGKSSMSHWLCGFIPYGAMDISRSQADMTLSAKVTCSPSEKKLSATEKGNLYIFQPAHKAPNMRRIPFIRAEAEYGRSSMPETTPGRRKTDSSSIFGEVSESENVSVWDSNAEGIRRSWRSSRTSSVGSRSAEDRSDAYVPDAESSWQWWRSGPDDDDYKDDTDDDEEDDSIFSWFNLDNFDILSAISMLRWLLPVAAVFLPWLFGGPMFLMMAFAVFPLVQKLLGLFVPRGWKAALQGRNSRYRQKQGKRSQSRKAASSGFWTETNYNPFLDSRGEPDFVNSNKDWERSVLRDSINQGSSSKLGGWDEEDDNFVIQKATRGNKKAALQRRRSRKEVPLLFRLLVALFPFLRSWGGFL